RIGGALRRRRSSFLPHDSRATARQEGELHRRSFLAPTGRRATFGAPDPRTCVGLNAQPKPRASQGSDALRRGSSPGLAESS
ncbi:MAG: hypothetical protein ACRDG5_06705, partial [Anaerolineales bacterium]